MRNGIVCFILLAVFVSVALVTVDVFGAVGFDLDTHPTLRWVMVAAYSIIILSFLALMTVILWRGLRGERTRY